MEETGHGLTVEELESKHLAELHELAAASGVPRYRVMRRAELIDALAAASAPPRDEAILDAEPVPVPAGIGAPEPDEEREDLDAWEWESREAAQAAEQEEAEAEDRLPTEPVREYADAETCTGVLDLVPDGYGFLRVAGLSRSPEDVYVSRAQVRRFDLRRGDELVGSAHPPRRSEQYPALARVDAVNGVPVEELDPARATFEDLTPIGAGET